MFRSLLNRTALFCYSRPLARVLPWSHQPQSIRSAMDTQGETPSHFGASVVDDSSCLRYFLEPNDTLQRRYEALRAYFVHRRPLHEIANQFGYTYDTLRQVIHQFRTQCRSGTPPLFSPLRTPGVRLKLPRPCPSGPRWPTDDACASIRDGACAPASPASSCSCRCWPNCVSITSSLRRAIPARR